MADLVMSQDGTQSPKKQLPSWVFFAIHLALLVLALSGHVALGSRWLTGLVAIVGIGALVKGLTRIPSSVPWAFRVPVRAICTVWVAVSSLAVCTLLLFVAPLKPGPTLNIGGVRVASYVGCDGATTDPCIRIRREWRPLPGVAIYRELFSIHGRDFSLAPVGNSGVRFTAPSFGGEHPRGPLDIVVPLL
jgi:hypothetical protein